MSKTDRHGPRDRRRVPRGGRRAYDAPGRAPAVLVADSYEAARRPCVRFLERFNFDVAAAASGEEAFALLSTHAPRVLLLEWTQAMTSGIRLRDWFAIENPASSVRVIAVAGNLAPDDEFPHADGLLIKPFSLDAMLAEIRHLLRRMETIA